MKNQRILLVLGIFFFLNNLYSQTDQVTFPILNFDLNAAPRTQLNSMSVKLFDDYHSYRPSVAAAPGNNTYGTLLAIYGRSNHWEHNLYFGADKKLYYRMCGYTSWTAEDGTIGGYNEWRTILDSKSDINSTGVLKMTGNGNHYFSQGNIGFGTTTPSTKIHVVGGNDVNLTGVGGYLTLGSTIGNHISIDDNEIMAKSGNLNAPLYLQVEGGIFNIHNAKSISQKFIVAENGDVSIGLNSNPTGFKLAVAGKILAEEIQVSASGTTPWPDFVFTPTYKLRTLSEVETFVNQKQHLPDVPSKAQVEEEGISLGEMNALLLQKIEELTLYVIEQQKEIEKNKNLENRILKLEATINKLNK